MVPKILIEAYGIYSNLILKWKRKLSVKQTIFDRDSAIDDLKKYPNDWIALLNFERAADIFRPIVHSE